VSGNSPRLGDDGEDERASELGLPGLTPLALQAIVRRFPN